MLPLHGTSQVYLPILVTFFEVLTSCSLPKELWAETPVSKWLLRANLGPAIEIQPGQPQTCTRQKWHNHEHHISITNTYRHCEGGWIDTSYKSLSSNLSPPRARAGVLRVQIIDNLCRYFTMPEPVFEVTGCTTLQSQRCSLQSTVQ